jgi:hypothetical protein
VAQPGFSSQFTVKLIEAIADGLVASELLSVNAFTVKLQLPGAVPLERPCCWVFAVVVTARVAVPVLELLKSSVWLLTASFEVTTQLAFGAVVLQANATAGTCGAGQVDSGRVAGCLNSCNGDVSGRRHLRCRNPRR